MKKRIQKFLKTGRLEFQTETAVGVVRLESPGSSATTGATTTSDSHHTEAILEGCSDDSSERDQDRLGIKVLYSPDEPSIDVIFVHGLTGRQLSTWTAEGATAPWPKLLLSQDIPEARISAFGYDADVYKFLGQPGQNKIRQHATNLLAAVADMRFEIGKDDLPIIFVAHSLGGLVCKNRSTPKNIRANWATIATNMFNVLKPTNKRIVDTLRPDSEVLEVITQEFHRMLRSREEEKKTSIRITCFAEELRVSKFGKSFMVVPISSAILESYTYKTIHSDHINMTKFKDRDENYKMLKNEIKRWTGQILNDLAADRRQLVPRREYDAKFSAGNGYSKSFGLERLVSGGVSGVKPHNVNIVAIQGLIGSLSRSWKHPNGTFWLNDFVPHALPGAAVFVFKCPLESIFELPIGSLQDLAVNFLDELRSVIREDYPPRPIIYLCHSIGGIVLKEAMNIAYDRYPDVWFRSKAVLFFATPHRGTPTIPLEELICNIIDSTLPQSSRQSSLREKVRQNSHQLHSIADIFAQRANAMMITCFCETSNVEDTVVDGKFASIGLKHEKIVSLEAGHWNLCQFESQHSANCRVVINCLKDIGIAAQKEMVNLSSSVHSSQSLDDSEKRCIEQLNTIDMTRIRSTLDSPTEGTLAWISQNPKYNAWIHKTMPTILCLTGHVGCGKTTISCFIIHYLSQSLTPNALVCWFFCSGKTGQQHDLNALLRTIIYQIVIQRRGLLILVRKASDLRPMLFDQFDSLWDLLVDVARHEKVLSINIIIDAIDECQESAQIRLVEHISKLTSYENNFSLKFFITSRPNSRAVQAIQKSPIDHTQLSLEENQDLVIQDVRLMVQQRMKSLADRGSCDPELRLQFERLLVDKAEGTFLWVSLILDSLEQRRLLAQSDLEKVKKLPQGLQALYEDFLRSIHEDDWEMGGNALRIICSSARPLTSEEIGFLLALGKASTSRAEYPILSDKTVQKLLHPLVRVNNGAVYLVHHSIKEFLLSLPHNRRESLASSFGVNVSRDALVLAKACMHYLSSEAFSIDLFSQSDWILNDSPVSPKASFSDEPQEGSESSLIGFDLEDVQIFKEGADLKADTWARIADQHKLLDYAAGNWATHFAQCSIDGRVELQDLAIALCDSAQPYLQNWSDYARTMNRRHEELPDRLDPMILACFFGHSSTIEKLLKENDQGRLEFGHGLYWAAKKGHINCVQAILTRAVGEDSLEPRSCYFKNQSPLAAAAQNGHLDCVRYFLEKGMFDVNEPSDHGLTPISLAAAGGHGDVIATLLSAKNLDPNTQDINGSTPLIWAAAMDCSPGVFNLLQDSRVNPKHRDLKGRNAISWAAAEGHCHVGETLLKNIHVEANDCDNRGWTPLIYATRNGHTNFVRLLVRTHRVNISHTDKSGRNAISWASERRESEDSTLYYLLKHDHRGADVADQEGWTPLAWALNPPGYPENVSFLIHSGLIDINKKDKEGRTPLSFAVSYGYLGIAQIMVRAKGVNVNLSDYGGRTALSYAAFNGDVKMIQLLLGVTGIEPDLHDNRGQTPLSLAARAGHGEAVLLLVRTHGRLNIIISVQKRTSDKSVAIFGYDGAGKATVIGNMIYKCGGIEMPVMEQFQKRGIKKYDQVLKELEAIGEPAYFYTPKHKVIISYENKSNADGVIVVVTPIGTSEQGIEKDDLRQLKEIGPLLKGNRAIILVNKL
ncbi:hypothetical protein EJ08DRAFT_696835 [Tothia fuscella]|uniref:protein S-acyltransferase n=1 Tax=Tothia fuscella TaxID=1048955 RepID=A0A9P4TYX5_9PEZI|nr:hypothetical protein EJ08DRAFT_696835 [Tothia fuscella]